MRVVVIGDVSWKGSYHLGDEAMTEVAITQLQRRGAEVTLIAGDTAVASDFYGVDTVPQFGFRYLKTRQEWEAMSNEILAGVTGEADIPEYAAQTVRAVQEADAVVIAGGGNLNSNWGHHIFERLALKRVAEASAVPLYISSQTVGPELNSNDREMLREIVDYAKVFGAREPYTAALVHEISGNSPSVVHTLDDALLLEPTQFSPEEQAGLALPERYIVGSFTFHSLTTGRTHEEMYRMLAGILDEIVAESDVDVLLLPHMGFLNSERPKSRDGDDYGHDRIAEYMKSGRVRSFAMMPARDVLAITAGAKFTVSTRYHPVVFGAGVGVPAVGIVTSYYSAVRMRGALENVGMEQFAIPFEAWEPFLGKRILKVLGSSAESIRDHVSAVGAQMREYQSRWWDGIVADIAGTGSPRLETVPKVEPMHWADERTTESLALARLAQEGTDLHRLNAVSGFPEEALRPSHVEMLLKQTQLDLKKTNAELKRLQQSETELWGKIAEMRHLLRPPGANLRDAIRSKVQKLRNR